MDAGISTYGLAYEVKNNTPTFTVTVTVTKFRKFELVAHTFF